MFVDGLRGSEFLWTSLLCRLRQRVPEDGLPLLEDWITCFEGMVFAGLDIGREPIDITAGAWKPLCHFDIEGFQMQDQHIILILKDQLFLDLGGCGTRLEYFVFSHSLWSCHDKGFDSMQWLACHTVQVSKSKWIFCPCASSRATRRHSVCSSPCWARQMLVLAALMPWTFCGPFFRFWMMHGCFPPKFLTLRHIDVYTFRFTFSNSNSFTFKLSDSIFKKFIDSIFKKFIH